jgi:biotin synthase
MSHLTRDNVRAIYDLPIPELVYRAATVHREHHDPLAVQRCTLDSIKTGRCPEDCKYCPQSAHYDTPVQDHGLKDIEDVLNAAKAARDSGSTRFCLGAAWRGPRDGQDFDTVLTMVRGIRDLGMEACVTLGLLTREQAQKLADAGLTSYNHNIDTSPEFYEKIISTRTFEDRLRTIGHVREAGISVCSGGIVGMGEEREDRIGFLHALATLDPPPESVPINVLVRVPGTPLEQSPPLDPIEIVRCVATARILMPTSRVRLSAGRREMSDELQALCFTAGANSIFAGEKLLTTPNAGDDRDADLFERLGLRAETSAESARERAHAGIA